nr:hypothetical protein [Rhodothermus marinus]
MRISSSRYRVFLGGGLLLLLTVLPLQAQPVQDLLRARILLNEDWRFFRYPSRAEADGLVYDVWPMYRMDADTAGAPKEAIVLKPWILPTGNPFIKDPARRYRRPPGHPGRDFPFVQPDFDDSGWERVDLPHDWAIRGPSWSNHTPRWTAAWAGCPARAWPGTGRKSSFRLPIRGGRSIWTSRARWLTPSSG